MRRRCAAADESTKSQCTRVFNQVDLVGTDLNVVIDLNGGLRTALLNQMKEIQVVVTSYENSEEYGHAEDLESYESISNLIFPWLPQKFLLPALPHPLLVLSVTLSMGALGSVLFMLQLQLSR